MLLKVLAFKIVQEFFYRTKKLVGSKNVKDYNFFYLLISAKMSLCSSIDTKKKIPFMAFFAINRSFNFKGSLTKQFEPQM